MIVDFAGLPKKKSFSYIHIEKIKKPYSTLGDLERETNPARLL